MAGAAKRAVAPIVLLAALAIMVHARFLEPADRAGLQLLTATRPAALTDGVNWIFRLGFAQVDTALALLWSAGLLVRQRSLRASLPPLLLLAAIGLQAGLRLVVNQPAPPSDTFELNRPFASHPVEAVLDTADASARQGFIVATTSLVAGGAPVPPLSPAAPAALASEVRGSFPSGHTARILFLVLLAMSEPGLAARGRGPRSFALRAACCALVALAGLVGYSAMYFGYHWPSDILGGYLIALAVYPVAALLRQGPSPAVPSPIPSPES